MVVDLPYGRRPIRLDLGARAATVVSPPDMPAPRAPVDRLLTEALDAPIASPRLEARVRGGDRVTIVVSDATRDEPRADLLRAVRARLPSVRLTIAIATGTHGRCGVSSLGIPPSLVDGATIVDHDGHDPRDLVLAGTTPRGTPVRVHRCALDADLVVATGCIRPHYFAGWGAGVKAVFPGLGAATEVRINHRLKEAPGSRAGVVDGNPCRADLEDAVPMLAPIFLLNVVAGPDLAFHDAVAGDVLAAFRAGAARATPWFSASAPRASVVVASDAMPVTASLYQAAKIIAAVAPIVDDGGTIVLVAECTDGPGPLDIVNHGIYEIGLRPRLPASCAIALVSSLDRSVVAQTFASYAPSIDAALAGSAGPLVVVPRASQLLLSRTA
ncbi:MAG TPA: lactate racemase domain-containing protein [Kofleriaceae bacterium]|nr:lactate racemase domain-containing protein [Kofleriaceae bacterium]